MRHMRPAAQESSADLTRRQLMRESVGRYVSEKSVPASEVGGCFNAGKR